MSQAPASATQSPSVASETGCAYCGLSLPGRRPARPEIAAQEIAATPPPEYCCLGCQFAAAVTREQGQQGAVRWTLARLGLSVFFTMNVVVFTMALWTQDFYGEDATEGALAAVWADLFRYLGLLFTLPVLWLLGMPLAESVGQQLRRRQIGSDLLLLIGVVAAAAYSGVSTFRGAGHVYYEVACVVLVAVTLGRWLEATGKLKTTEALDALHKLLPDEVLVLRGGQGETVPTGEVCVGETIRVLPGQRLALDGRIVRGAAAIDAQVLTGESRPEVKQMGDDVFGGTLDLDGDLLVQVTAPASAGTLARLIEQVRAARQARGHYQQLADRISAVFMPGVVVLALAVFGWHGYHAGLDQGLMTALAVVLIACPCALGLATPMAVWTALGAASQRQILFRNGEALERLASIRAVRFDKTGTLTTGEPRVARLLVSGGVDRAAALRWASLLAAGSTHSFSRAIADFAPLPIDQSLPADQPLPEVRTLAGLGLELDDAAGAVRLGSVRWLRSLGLSAAEGFETTLDEALASGEAVSAVAWDGAIRAAFVFQEGLRDDAATCLAWCGRQGLDVAILTGDHAQRGAALAGALGVAVEAELLPADKLAAIRRAQQTLGPVAMVGDGINDAPALAAADVGVALGCGADVSRETAGVCLLSNELGRLVEAIELAQRTVRVIRQNLGWSFGYNVLGIGLAATGWLNPVFASIVMTVSSALVIGNSLRLALPEDAGQAEGIAPHSDVATPATKSTDEPLLAGRS